MLRVLALYALTLSVATAQVYQLTTDTFDVALQEGPLFVKFYAPWCARARRGGTTLLLPAKTSLAILHGASQF